MIKTSKRQLYRDVALSSYARRQQKIVFPDFLSKKALTILWIMLILLLAGVLSIAFFLAQFWLIGSQ